MQAVESAYILGAMHAACLLAAALIAVVFPAAAQQAEKPAREYVIHIVEGPPYFEPQFDETVLEEGSTIRWINKGAAHHTVTAYACGRSQGAECFDSGPMAPEGIFEIKAPAVPPGRNGVNHWYGCMIHPIMSGVLPVAAVKK